MKGELWVVFPQMQAQGLVGFVLSSLPTSSLTTPSHCIVGASHVFMSSFLSCSFRSNAHVGGNSFLHHLYTSAWTCQCNSKCLQPNLLLCHLLLKKKLMYAPNFELLSWHMTCDVGYMMSEKRD